MSAARSCSSPIDASRISLQVRPDLTSGLDRPWDDTCLVSWLDVMLVALLVLSLLSGYRRGATLQVIGLIGLAVGVVAGVLLAPRVATLASSPSGASGLAMGTVLIGGAGGNPAGWGAGRGVRRARQEAPGRRGGAGRGRV